MSDPEWREFERLVSRIEKAAGPRDMEIKSPDRIADVVTGTLREVDASIRYKVGSATLLITVECRRRKDKQDVTWIEQLVTKKKNLGISKTIAVSLRGFSAEARDLAARSGIDLRRLKDVGSEEIQTWLLPSMFLHIRPQVEITSSPEVFYTEHDLSKVGPAVAPGAVQRAQEEDGYDAKVFRSPDREELLSLNEIWSFAKKESLWPNVPLDGTRVSAQIDLEFEPGILFVPTVDGEEEVRRIRLQVDLWHISDSLPFDESKFFHYTDEQGSEIQRSEFGIKVKKLGDVVFRLQSQRDSKSIAFEFTVTRPS